MVSSPFSDSYASAWWHITNRGIWGGRNEPGWV